MDLEQVTETAVSTHAQKLGNLAASLGYEGTLTLGAIEDEIRFYQRRSVEDVLELGKRLLLMKEMTPHGEFSNRVQLLGFSVRLSQKFMQAARKFCKSENFSHLKNLSSINQGKFLELVVLDDDEIKELSEGGSVLDIQLDEIDCMTASELRKKLREAKSDIEAKEQVIHSKDQKANELLAENAKLKSPAQIKKRAETEAQQLELAAIKTLNAAKDTITPAFKNFTDSLDGVLTTAAEKELPELYDYVDELLIFMCQRFAKYVHSLGTQVTFEEIVKPSWITDEPTESVEE